MRWTHTLGLRLAGVLAATAVAAPAWAQCPAADSFEPNDDCVGAAMMTAGSTTGLTLFGAANGAGENQDFFQIDVPTGNILTVDLFFLTANGDIDVYLYDSTSPNCGGEMLADYLVRGFTGTDNESISWTNNSGSTQTYWVMVDPFGGTFDCNDYDMTLTVAPDPCASPTDDSFEENDTCATAASLATGSHTGLFVSETDFDYYTVNVAAGDLLTVDASYVGQDVDLRLFDDLACTNEVVADFGFGGAAQVTWANGTGSAATVVLAAEVAAGEGCNNYDLNLTTVPDPCQALGDDSFEDNDDCASAVSLPIGTTTGLRIFGAASTIDDDFYVISVPAGDILTVDALFTHANGDIDVALYDDAACSNQVSGSFSVSDNETVTGTNSTGAAANFYLEVYAYGSSHDCNDYDLVVSTGPDPCVAAVDDGLEENDDCSTATSMTDGLTTDLFVSKSDPDYYEVIVADGDTLTVDTFFTDATGDLDLELFVGQADCIADVVEDGSYSVSDSESVTYTNNSGSQQTVVINVYHYPFDSVADCNEYDMQITGSGGDVATPFCFGDGTTDVGGGPVSCPCGNDSALGAGEGCNSSLGFGATLASTGSNVVANDDLVFSVSQAVPNQPSMLVQGTTQVAFPFKDGVLCLGSPTERIEVVFLDANGEGSTATSIVTGGNVSPGDTRYYQQWYRDPGGVSPCGTGSNFSQGLIVDWQ